jgi:hypothetical protein
VRRIAIRCALALAAAVLAGSCSPVVPARPASVRVTCPDAADVTQGPVLACQDAIAAALGRVAGGAPPVAAAFQYGRLCPPNARCFEPPATQGVVVIEYEDRTCAYADVTLDDRGAVLASAPATYPPAEWVDAAAAPEVGCLTNAR